MVFRRGHSVKLLKKRYQMFGFGKVQSTFLTEFMRSGTGWKMEMFLQKQLML